MPRGQKILNVDAQVESAKKIAGNTKVIAEKSAARLQAQHDKITELQNGLPALEAQAQKDAAQHAENQEVVDSLQAVLDRRAERVPVEPAIPSPKS